MMVIVLIFFQDKKKIELIGKDIVCASSGAWVDHCSDTVCLDVGVLAVSFSPFKFLELNKTGNIYVSEDFLCTDLESENKIRVVHVSA